MKWTSRSDCLPSEVLPPEPSRGIVLRIAGFAGVLAMLVKLCFTHAAAIPECLGQGDWLVQRALRSAHDRHGHV